MQKSQRVSNTSGKLLVASVAVAALGTGLLAQPAQAATTPASSATAVGSSASQASASSAAATSSAQSGASVASSIATPASLGASSTASPASSIAASAASTGAGQGAQSVTPTAERAASAATVHQLVAPSSTASTERVAVPADWTGQRRRALPAGSLRMNKMAVSAVRTPKLAVAEDAATTTDKTMTPTYTDDNGFVYTANDNNTGYVISGYTGNSKDIVIPDTFNPVATNPSGSKWVVGIADSVFANKGITSLDIGKYVQTIGSYTFENDDLKQIIFNQDNTSLWEIGASAFAGNQLTGALTLPKSVTTIGDSAFIGNGLGDGTGNQLTSLNLSEDTGGKLDIYANAFANNALVSVVLPDNINTIRKSAFANNQLTTLELGKGLTEIDESAFENNALTSVIIPDKVTTIDTSAFANNAKLSQVTFGQGLTSIGDRAFFEDALTGEVTIPDTVKTIGDFAFTGNNIQTLTLGTQASQLKAIGNSAFADNKKLTGTLVIPDSVNFVNESAFANDALTGLNLGKSTGTIGNSAFANNQLTNLTISNGIEHINDSAFAGNRLTHLDLGTGVKTIGNSAFVGSTAGNQLTGNLTIPDTVTAIGNSAFQGNKIVALTLGDEQAQLDTIGTAAFASNQLAGDLVIPNKVTSIGNSAFKSNFLTGVESKGSIGSVVDYAFADNQLSLANIKITVDNNKLGDDAFASQTSPLTVGVGISGRWLTGVRAAIEKLIPKDTLKLGTTLVFTRNGSELTYDNQTDQLELPEGFNSYLDNLTVALASSGTTGTATDHTGNYSNSSLTLTWSIPNGDSTPADPESTPINSASSNSQQPAQSDQLTKPAQPHQQVQPSRSKSAGNKSLRRSPRTTKTSQSRQDQRQATTGHQHQDSQPVVQRRRQGFTHNVALTAPAVNWQYRSGDRPLTPTKKQATKASTQLATTQLPQTSEHHSIWQVLGFSLLLSLSWVGHRVRHHE